MSNTDIYGLEIIRGEVDFHIIQWIRMDDDDGISYIDIVFSCAGETIHVNTCENREEAQQTMRNYAEFYRQNGYTVATHNADRMSGLLEARY